MKKINKLVKLSLSALLLITLIPASITAETDPAIETGGYKESDPQTDPFVGDVTVVGGEPDPSQAEGDTGGSTQVDPNKDTAAGDGQYSGNINWNDDDNDDSFTGDGTVSGDPDPSAAEGGTGGNSGSQSGQGTTPSGEVDQPSYEDVQKALEEWKKQQEEKCKADPASCETSGDDDPTVNPDPEGVPTEDERKETYINVELSDVYCDNTDFTSFCVVTNEDLLDTYKADLETAADKVLIKKNGEKEFTSKEALDDVYVISYNDSKDLTGLVYGTKKIVVETSYGSVILPANHLYVFDGTKTRTNYLDVAMNYSQIVLGDRTKFSMTGSVIDASRLDEVVDYEFNENTAYEVYVVSESTDETDSQKKLINAASKIESKEDYNVKLDDHVLFELSIAAKSLDLEALEVKEDTDIKMKSDSYLHLNVTKPYGLFKTDESKHFMNNMYHILDEATNSVEKVELPIYTSDAYYDIAITSMSPYVYVYKGYKAQYKFLSADSNVLPEGIETLVEDENMYVENEEMYPVLPSKTIVNTNDGVWEFKGYDIEKTIASGKGIVPFVGTWKYTETPTYTVTWVDDNGTVLEKDEKVKKDTWPTYDSKTPSKASTKQYTYTFLGWDKELSPVTQDVTYTAVYKKTAVKYKVTFVDDDGSILKAPTEYEYGTKAANIAQPSTPKKASDGKYTYTFAGWDKTIVDVTADAVYTATYKKTKIEDNSRTEADVYYSNVAPKMGDC